MNTKKQYRSILKTTSLFGGVQLLKIFFAVIRSKAAAIFLGPTGVGILGFLNSVLNIIGQFSKLGVDLTIVREVAYQKNKNTDISKLLYVIKRLIWFTGMFGALVMALLSPLLSRWTFGNGEYTYSFLIVSIVILLRQIVAGRLATIQGLKKLKLLARVNIVIAIVTTIITVGFYYLYGIEGIVYSILVGSLASLFVALKYTYGIYENSLDTKLNFSELFKESKSLLKLGFYLSIVGVITSLAVYIVQLFLRKEGTLEDVGFYYAAFIVLNTYVGMVFNALRTDYFPRLSSIHDIKEKLNEVVNQQARVTTLMITPVVILFIIGAQFIVKLIYSEVFIVIVPLLCWAMLGTIFKSASFSLGYVLLAKNDSNLFLKTTFSFNITYVVLQIVGYLYYGLEGIGIAYCIYFFVHLIVLIILTKVRYKLRLEKGYYSILGVSLFFTSLTVLVYKLNFGIYTYMLYAIIVLISFFYFYRQLNKLIDIKTSIKKYLNRNKN